MIVVGVDGANPRTVIEPARRGALPNLSGLLEEGTGGSLRSVSTSSAAAWTSHLTGVKPETHGVEGFTTDGRFVRTDDIAVKTYPELLNEAGTRVGLVNIPLTYPPLELEIGFCVPGQLTPVDESEFATPATLQETLDEFDYEVDIQYGDRQYAFVDDDLDVDPSRILEDVTRVERKRLEVARHLLAEYEWDLFFVLVNGTDPMQHYFWDQIVDARLEDTEMFEVYELIDDFVGDIRSAHPEENLLLFSDHGFREDVWGADDQTRERWRRIRRLGSRLLPGRLKETRVRQLGLDLLAGAADATNRGGAPEDHTGAHDPEGVWLLSGPAVEPTADATTADFLDLPATVLHLMDHPVPEAYEGTVRTDVLADDRPVERSDVDLSCDRHPPKHGLDTEQQLGYLGYVEMVEDE